MDKLHGGVVGRGAVTGCGVCSCLSLFLSFFSGGGDRGAGV